VSSDRKIQDRLGEKLERKLQSIRKTELFFEKKRKKNILSIIIGLQPIISLDYFLLLFRYFENLSHRDNENIAFFKDIFILRESTKN
jgi:hypothetical protein